jgi:hypothetical protein
MHARTHIHSVCPVYGCVYVIVCDCVCVIFCVCVRARACVIVCVCARARARVQARHRAAVAQKSVEMMRRSNVIENGWWHTEDLKIYQVPAIKKNTKMK